jgi:division protein CdvB (Snf7/Vps24/ESCRT-III family)
MTIITYTNIPRKLKNKLKLQKKNLKNNKIINIETLKNIINKLKTKLNTLINDVLGVEHTIDNIYNYNNTNLKEDLQEINEQIQGVYTDINNITDDVVSSVNLSD